MTSGDISPELVQKYLRGRLPERDGLVVDQVRRIVGGMSRVTHFVDISWTSAEGRQAETLNLRTDHRGLSTLTVPLEWEYQVLTRLRRTEIPVAEPFWYEEDPDLIGLAPFYFREVVKGSARSKPLFEPGSEERRRSLGRQMVTHLARLHTLDWQGLGFADFMTVPESPAECMNTELDQWESFYREHAIEAKPMAAEIFGRLRREQPPPPDRICLLWGDVGIGQFIYQDDELVALTDFEISHLGDPMMDLAAALTRGSADLLPVEEIFELYERESGIAVDLERIEYCTRVLAVICFAWHPVLKDISGGRPPIDAALMRLGAGLSWQWMDIVHRRFKTDGPG